MQRKRWGCPSVTRQILNTVYHVRDCSGHDGQMDRPSKSPKSIGYEHERKCYDERKGPCCMQASPHARMNHA